MRNEAIGEHGGKRPGEPDDGCRAIDGIICRHRGSHVHGRFSSDTNTNLGLVPDLVKFPQLFQPRAFVVPLSSTCKYFFSSKIMVYSVVAAFRYSFLSPSMDNGAS